MQGDPRQPGAFDPAGKPALLPGPASSWEIITEGVLIEDFGSRPWRCCAGL